MGVIKGGRNQCDFYRLRKKSDGSGYEVLDQLGDTVAATLTIDPIYADEIIFY